MRTLYTFFRSSTSYRVRIALSVKGLDWEAHAVNLTQAEQRADEFLAVNPQGLVPVLVEDGAAISQAQAILEYLEERYPDPPLLPADPLDRAYVRALANIVACDIHPLNNARVLKLLGGRFGLDQEAVQEWYAHWIATGLGDVEAMLAARGKAGAFCLGDTLTMADICLVPQIANARRFDCDLTPYPQTVAIADRTAALDVVARVAPATQADAF